MVYDSNQTCTDLDETIKIYYLENWQAMFFMQFHEQDLVDYYSASDVEKGIDDDSQSVR